MVNELQLAANIGLPPGVAMARRRHQKQTMYTESCAAAGMTLVGNTPCDWELEAETFFKGLFRRYCSRNGDLESELTLASWGRVSAGPCWVPLLVNTTT